MCFYSSVLHLSDMYVAVQLDGRLNVSSHFLVSTVLRRCADEMLTQQMMVDQV